MLSAINGANAKTVKRQ